MWNSAVFSLMDLLDLAGIESYRVDEEGVLRFSYVEEEVFFGAFVRPVKHCFAVHPGWASSYVHIA
jgi:hypothetical protein